jgi:hypothetical protein
MVEQVSEAIAERFARSVRATVTGLSIANTPGRRTGSYYRGCFQSVKQERSTAGDAPASTNRCFSRPPARRSHSPGSLSAVHNYQLQLGMPLGSGIVHVFVVPSCVITSVAAFDPL